MRRSENYNATHSQNPNRQDYNASAIIYPSLRKSTHAETAQNWKREPHRAQQYRVATLQQDMKLKVLTVRQKGISIG